MSKTVTGMWNVFYHCMAGKNMSSGENDGIYIVLALFEVSHDKVDDFLHFFLNA